MPDRPDQPPLAGSGGAVFLGRAVPPQLVVFDFVPFGLIGPRVDVPVPAPARGVALAALRLEAVADLGRAAPPPSDR